MNNRTQNERKPVAWEGTNVGGLLRHVKSGTYYSRISVGGKLRWESLRTKLKSVAEERIREKKAGRRKARMAGAALRSGKMTFGEAAKSFLEQLEKNPDISDATKIYRQKGLKKLNATWPQLSETDVRKLGVVAVRDWWTSMRASGTPYVPPGAKSAIRNSTGMSATTANCALEALRQVLDVAVESGAMFENPARHRLIKSAPRSPARKDLPSKDKFSAMVAVIRSSGAAAARPCGDMVELLAYTGARIKEARALVWDDVDLKREIVTLRVTKNKDVRDVPMCPELRELLTAMHERRKPEPGDSVLEVNECQRSIDRACKIAGMKRLTAHGLRHLFATVAIEAGIDIPTVAKLMGHRDGGALAMKTYGHLRQEHAQAAMAKLKFNT